jgi:hypothetical protein
VTANLRLTALRTLSVSALGLVAAWALPLLVHSLPHSGPVPLGAQLLPLFYVAVVLVLRGESLSALLVAASAPWLNAQLTGMPVPPMLPLLTAELLIFTGLLALIQVAVPEVARFTAPIAYLASAMLAGLALGSGDIASIFVRALTNAWPGMLILLALGAIAGHERGART